MNERLVNYIIFLVATAWFSSFVLDAALKEYEPPQTIHALMLIVVGAACGAKVIKRTGVSNGD